MELQTTPIESEHFATLVANGYFTGKRVSHYNGEIVRMNVAGQLHSHLVTNLYHWATLQVAYLVRQEQPLTLAPQAKFTPEPDIALVTMKSSIDTWPVADGVALAIEVTDSTGRKDELMRGQYAAAGIPELWQVDARGRTITKYCNQTGGFL